VFKYTDTFGVITGVIAIGLFIYTVYKDYLQIVRVKVYIGDTIDLVRSTTVKTRKIQLICNFVNPTNKIGVVHKLILKVTSKGTKEMTVFTWNQFFIYPERHLVKPESKPFPIIVGSKSTVFKGIEFISEGLEIIWNVGEYSLELVGWVNKKNIQERPNMKSEFSITIDSGLKEELYREERLKEPICYPVQVNDWKRN